MANVSHLLTPEIEEKLLGFIRAGGYPHVAAEAAGVPRERFAAWLRRGRRRNAPEPYRSFYRRVQQAVATARLKAEVETFGKNPFYWLRHGPGREAPKVPGWTNPVKPGQGDDAGGQELLTPEGARIFALLLQALEPFPEARQAAAAAIGRPFPRERRAGRNGEG